MNNKWNQIGADYYVAPVGTFIDKLPVSIFTLKTTPMEQIYLERLEDSFGFSFRVYGMEQSFVERVVHTYNKSDGNLGILLNGLKGTGKTVTCKMIANMLKLPVILINRNPASGLVDFMNAIQQDVIFLFDEFEKTFASDNGDWSGKKSTKLLTIMDGVLTSKHRKVFLLTTNDLSVDTNLLQRPGRVRYLKTFGNLSVAHIIEIIDDQLIHKQFRDDLIKFISQLEMITVDIVSSIVHETNLHGDTPTVYAPFFNVKKMDARMDVYKVEIDKKTKIPKEVLFKAFAEISPAKITNENIGNYLQLNKHLNLGAIAEVKSNNVIVTKTEDYDKDDKLTATLDTYRLEPTPTYHSSFRTYFADV